jgi:hypothetical protein
MPTDEYLEHAETFVSLARDWARSLGLNVAQARGSSLYFRQNLSPEALAGLASAAAKSAGSAAPAQHPDLSRQGHALAQIKEHDVTLWWTWTHPKSPPQLEAGEEFYSAEEVVDLCARLKWGCLEPRSIQSLLGRGRQS